MSFIDDIHIAFRKTETAHRRAQAPTHRIPRFLHQTLSASIAPANLNAQLNFHDITLYKKQPRTILPYLQPPLSLLEYALPRQLEPLSGNSSNRHQHFNVPISPYACPNGGNYKHAPIYT